MRTFRLLLTITSLSCITVGGLVACGGDDSSGGTITPDASAPDGKASSSSSSSSGGSTSSSTSGGPIDSGAPPTAAATSTTVYLGQTATIDGSGSTAGATYAWTITAPAGSTVTSASLQNASTAKPSFVPDVLGQYSIGLTVTANGKTANTTTLLNVVDAPVFFLQSDNAPDAATNVSTASLRMTGATATDGGAGTGIACFASDAGGYNQTANFASMLWADWWEAPAGQASRGALVFQTNDDGGVNTSLLAVTTADTCASAPHVLDGVAGPPVTTSGAFAVPTDTSEFDLVRFSPDGNRIAYLRTVGGKTTVASIGFDGSAPHNAIAPRAALSDGAPDPNGGRFGGSQGPRPVWVNATTIAWLQTVDSNTWQIVSAPDQDGSTPSLVLSCTGNVPAQFDVLPNGNVIVSQQIDAPDANSNVVDIVSYTPAAGTKACGTPTSIGKMVSRSGSSGVGDFAVTADKSRLAFIAIDDTPDSGTTWTIRVAPTDGSTTPAVVATIPPAAIGSGHPGPRWIAGGTQLVWSTDNSAIDAGGNTGTVLAVAPVAAADAGAHVVASGSDSQTTYQLGSNTCSFGYGVGSAFSGVGFLGLLGLGLGRRRRNGEKK